MDPASWGGDDAIEARLRESYGLAVRQIRQLARGLDADAAVFRVDTRDGSTYFLKLKRDPPAERSVLVPHALQAAVLGHVVAPLPTRTGALWAEIGEVYALLYPFVDGQTGFEQPPTPEQWADLGRTLASIHATDMSPDLLRVLPVEQFVPNPRWIAPLESVLAGAHRSVPADDLTRETSAFLDKRHAAMRLLLDRTTTLGDALRDRGLPPVLCHSDLHLGNVILDRAGGLHVVDWDQPILAPRECDLMLLSGTAVGGFVEGSAEEAAFRSGYGEIEPDRLAMAYYYHERVTTDLGAFAHELYWQQDADNAARRTAARWLRVLFEPGRSVEAAQRAYAGLAI